MADSSSELGEILQELKLRSPDISESYKRNLILPQTSGELYNKKYTRFIKRRLRKLNEYICMLNAGLITEMEYESRKAEILSNIKAFRKSDLEKYRPRD